MDIKTRYKGRLEFCLRLNTKQKNDFMFSSDVSKVGFLPKIWRKCRHIAKNKNQGGNIWL